MENPYAFSFVVPPTEGCSIHPEVHLGMTLRDYFAAKAMQGMLANPGDPDHASPASAHPRELACVVFQIADAMLKERGASR